MVESLVALVVLSVGMLGIAGLYVSTLKAERTAQLRTQAVSLVTDMMDRIRANAPARGAYDLTKGYPSDPPTTHNCVASATPCTSQDLAADDLANWVQTAKTILPGPGEADVSVTANGQTDVYTVSVSWQEPGETERFRYRSSLSLIPVGP